MSVLEHVQLEMVTPRVTEFELPNLRSPEDDEILLAHGVTLRELRSTEFPALALEPSRYQCVRGELSDWHADRQMIAAVHFTAEGACQASFTGLPKFILNSLGMDVRRIVPQLEEQARVIDTLPGDVLVFNGLNGADEHVAMLHKVQAVSLPRLAYVFPIRS